MVTDHSARNGQVCLLGSRTMRDSIRIRLLRDTFAWANFGM